MQVEDFPRAIRNGSFSLANGSLSRCFLPFPIGSMSSPFLRSYESISERIGDYWGNSANARMNV